MQEPNLPTPFSLRLWVVLLGVFLAALLKYDKAGGGFSCRTRACPEWCTWAWYARRRAFRLEAGCLLAELISDDGRRQDTQAALRDQHIIN